MLYIHHIKGQILKSALFCGVVFLSLSGVSSLAWAGFEWTPKGQDLSAVPVVAPPSKPRAVLVDQSGIAPLPSLDPGMQFDPNAKIHTMRRRGASSSNGTSPKRSKSSVIQTIENTPAVSVSPRLPAPVSSFTPPPVSPPVSGAVSKSLPTRVSPSRSMPSFMPMPEDHAVSSNSQDIRRKTNNSQPVPIVVHAMRDLSRELKSVAPSYQPRKPAPVAFSPSSAPAPRLQKPEVSLSRSPLARASSGGGIKINPYPKQADSVAVSAPFSALPSVAPAPAPAPVADSSLYPVVPGFGSDIPLIMALQQIAPAHYIYSFAPSVNLAQHVSWQGDRPWNVVLADMLAPLGLQARLGENTIAIQ